MREADRVPGVRAESVGKSSFLLIGNRLAVDFGNTVYSPRKPGGALGSWADLVEFLVATETVGLPEVGSLRAVETAAPEAAADTLAKGIRLRDAIRRVLASLAARESPAKEPVEVINAVLRWTEGYDQLVPAAGGWQLGFVEREKRLEWLLAAIARSAANLVVEGPAAPLRKCGNPACVLYFYDTSRTHRRRWCQMAVCGNRNKVAAHFRRARGTGRRA